MLALLAGPSPAKGSGGSGSDVAVAGPQAPERTVEFPDRRAWTVQGGLAWAIGNSNKVIFVPRGFVHDSTSVPPTLWSLASHTDAAVVHDYLYWAQPCSRLQSDNLLMIAMEQAGVAWVRRQLVFRAVRAEGEAVWRRNADERAIGMPRINPYGHVPEGLTWPQLRARMFHDGIRDVRHEVSDEFCRLGNTREAPR
ncbi:MAG: DUF1353 domain-containing protein [Pseudomonadota bacterium]|nr:DUF1353 domain-containing protein [Pseudomonadota bacterium]